MLDLKSLIPFHHKSHDIVQDNGKPRDPFLSLRQEMDQLFDNFFNGTAIARRDVGWGMPNMEVTNGEKDLVVTAELPGMKEDDVEIKISGDMLTLEGEKKEESEKKEGDTTYSERRYGKFSRAIRLPFEPEDQKVDASFENGVLTVRIERPEGIEQKTRQIEIKKTA